MLTTVITHALALFLGVGGGWYVKGKYGARVQAAEDAVKKA